MKACNNLPWISLENRDLPRHTTRLESNVPFDLEVLKLERERWFDIVQGYSKRSLTFETDKADRTIPDSSKMPLVLLIDILPG
jgi:hypothetical protein